MEHPIIPSVGGATNVVRVTRFCLDLESTAPDAQQAMRLALKTLLRRYGLRCTSISASTATRGGAA